MRPAVIEKLAGTTIKVTFVNTGNTAVVISSALYDTNENMVDSIEGISSGNGMYFAVHLLPNSPQWLVNEWNAYIGVNSFRERQFVRVRAMEVD
jgi:hypothetical protein